MTEGDLEMFIREAWVMGENKSYLSGYGLSIEDAIALTRDLKIANFFEGMCAKVFTLRKFLSEDDILGLIHQIAINILQDKKFRKFCSKL